MPRQKLIRATATRLLELASGALRSRRLAEVEEIRLAVQWAVVTGHPRDDRDLMVVPPAPRSRPPLRPCDRRGAAHSHGVARIEGVGPIDVRQLHEVLGHADVTVTPVLDLAQRRRVDAYEHPEVVKDHVWVQTGGDCFPFTPRSATREGVDYDHAIPYDDTGPPGQTGPHNSGPLRRRHHRTKTHGGLTTRVVGPGRHLWRTLHGQAFLVDQRGTSRLTAEQAVQMAEAIVDGVELYFAAPREYESA